MNCVDTGLTSNRMTYQFLTASEVASQIGCNAMKIVRAIESGQIVADAKASRFHLFKRDRLEELRAALADTTPKPKQVFIFR